MQSQEVGGLSLLLREMSEVGEAHSWFFVFLLWSQTKCTPLLLPVLAEAASLATRSRTDWLSVSWWCCFREGWPAGTIVCQQASVERC